MGKWDERAFPDVCLMVRAVSAGSRIAKLRRSISPGVDEADDALITRERSRRLQRRRPRFACEAGFRKWVTRIGGGSDRIGRPVGG